MGHEKTIAGNHQNPRLKNGWARLTLILIFALAMGLLEAICVI